MSATGRGSERRPSDYYPTPAWCVHRLLEDLALPGGVWLEPSAGEGAIIRAVNSRRFDVDWIAIEVREECAPALRAAGADAFVADFLGPDVGWTGRTRFFDVALLNPPFTHAQAFIERCKAMASWVCALERLNFLEGEERCEWLRADPPDVYVLPNRPSFTGDGTDSIAYAWFVWGPVRNRAAGRVQVLPVTPAAERRVPKLVLPEGVGQPAQVELL
jgi:hypothetical protein